MYSIVCLKLFCNNLPFILLNLLAAVGQRGGALIVTSILDQLKIFKGNVKHNSILISLGTPEQQRE